MANIKLTYFNIPGRAELIRLILAQAEVSFTDERITREEFVALKPSLPNGQLPVLNFNGTVLSQSIAIARFLANEYGLAGKSNLEKAQVDELVDTMMDLFNGYAAPTFRAKDEDEKKRLKGLLVEKAEQSFGQLEKRLGGAQYFVGNNLTWVDLLFYQFAGMVGKLADMSLDGTPSLKELAQRVADLPNIKKWNESRSQ